MEAVKTKQSAEVRQAEIVRVVLDLAAQRCPGDITTVDIAKAIGLTQGAVFRHYPTKDSIWLAVMSWVEVALLGAIGAAAASAGDPIARLEAVFRAHIRFVAANPGVPRVIFHELQRPDGSQVKGCVQRILQAYRKTVSNLMEEAKREGLAAQDIDVECATALFIGAAQGLVMQSTAAGSPKALTKVAEGVLKVLLAGITRK